MELVSKLTVKSVAGGIKFKEFMKHEEDSPGSAYPICKIYGIASAMKGGASEYGEFVRFLGDFRGVNANTGQVYHSGALILPRIAENLLFGALSSGATKVEFAFDIGIRYDETTPTKYAYVIVPLIESAQSDPLRAIEEKLRLPPALPAPQGAQVANKGKSKVKDEVAA